MSAKFRKGSYTKIGRGSPTMIMTAKFRNGSYTALCRGSPTVIMMITMRTQFRNDSNDSDAGSCAATGLVLE